MTDPTRTTGATPGQIEAACERGKYWHEMSEGDQRSIRAQIAYWSEYLIPEDQCIVPRSFVAAVDAAIDAAEELDYSPPYIRIPLGRWEDVANARDTFREGLRSSEPPSIAHTTTVAQLDRQCSLTFAAITDTIDGLIARIAALEAEIEMPS